MAHVTWTPEKDQQLIRLRDEGLPATAIARAMDIGVMAVRSRSETLIRLGVVERKKSGRGGYTDPVAQFHSKVDRSAGPEGCWPWLGGRAHFGHGKLAFAVGGLQGTVHASRVAFALEHGRPPAPGLVIRHSCDNPPCCNPAHLLEGTAADNVRDQIERGRFAGGRR